MDGGWRGPSPFELFDLALVASSVSDEDAPPLACEAVGLAPVGAFIVPLVSLCTPVWAPGWAWPLAWLWAAPAGVVVPKVAPVELLAPPTPEAPLAPPALAPPLAA